jgi:chorismate mutase
MAVRGVRGATIAEDNTREAILSSTAELLKGMVAANGISTEDVACAIFSTTRDLNAEFPAVAARQMGWTEVALLCGHEMDVPDAMGRVIRILLLLNTETAAGSIAHLYLGEAKNLRVRGADAGVSTET